MPLLGCVLFTVKNSHIFDVCIQEVRVDESVSAYCKVVEVNSERQPSEEPNQDFRIWRVPLKHNSVKWLVLLGT